MHEGTSTHEAQAAEAETPSRFRFLAAAIPALALLAYGFVALFAWHDDGWRPDWDCATYVLTGRALANGEGYTYLGHPFFLRPPGIAWLVALFGPGDGPFDASSINRAMMLFAGLMVGAIYYALRRRHGRWVALGAALLTGTSPIVVDLFNFVYGEFAFLALVFLGIALLERSAEGTRRGTRAIAGALSLAAAFYVRTVALVLLPALLFQGARGSARGRARRLLPFLVLLVLAAPWFVYARGAARDAERPAHQLRLFDYSTALLREDPGDPDSQRVSLAGFGERFAANGTEMLTELAGNVIGLDGALAAGLLAALGAFGCLRAVRAGPSILDWFALANLGILLAYFTFAARLLVPLIPFAYAYLFAALLGMRSDEATPGQGARVRGALGAVLFAVLLGLNLARLPDRLDPYHADGELTRAGHKKDELELIADWVNTNTPRDAVLLSANAPILAVLTGRRVYSFRFPRDPNLLERYRPDYVVFERQLPSAALAFLEARSERSWTLPTGRDGVEVHIFRIAGDAD